MYIKEYLKLILMKLFIFFQERVLVLLNLDFGVIRELNNKIPLHLNFLQVKFILSLVLLVETV